MRVKIFAKEHTEALTLKAGVNPVSQTSLKTIDCNRRRAKGIPKGGERGGGIRNSMRGRRRIAELFLRDSGYRLLSSALKKLFFTGSALMKFFRPRHRPRNNLPFRDRVAGTAEFIAARLPETRPRGNLLDKRLYLGSTVFCHSLPAESFLVLEYEIRGSGAARKKKKKRGATKRVEAIVEREGREGARGEGAKERERGSGDGDEDDDDGSFLPRSELFAVALGTSPRAEGGNKTNGNARR